MSCNRFPFSLEGPARYGGDSASCVTAIDSGESAPMPIESFVAAVSSPHLRTVATHWCTVRGTLMMPSWAALQPSVMARQLSILWAYRYDQGTGRFVGRLAGDNITQILGKSIRGVPMENVFAPGAFEGAYGLFQRVAREPAIYLNSGRVFGYLGRIGLGESIILPLSSDGVLADGILGVTEYHHSRAAADMDDVSCETWYDLRLFRQSKLGTRIEPPLPVGSVCGGRKSYRERASEMLKLAEMAATEETRIQFLNLAQHWDRLEQAGSPGRQKLLSSE